MSIIKEYINHKNNLNEKILSVFLTSGFPCKESFPELALKIFETGADILEIGFPFSDPLADGPIIQSSSYQALQKGINLTATFNYVSEIRKHTDKPIILMGYANPVLSYGVSRFAQQAKASGVNGIIIPDVPIEEYEDFFSSYFLGLDIILLITPTTTDERIKLIDEKSSGFVYCVSVSGTTGLHHQNKTAGIEFIKRAQNTISKNKMLAGFGISNGDDANAFTRYCDGVIVGSAIIKSLMDDDNKYSSTIKLVKSFKQSLLKS
jgi:tryptophan synthase alpha chain